MVGPGVRHSLVWAESSMYFERFGRAGCFVRPSKKRSIGGSARFWQSGGDILVPKIGSRSIIPGALGHRLASRFFKTMFVFNVSRRCSSFFSKSFTPC